MGQSDSKSTSLHSLIFCLPPPSASSRLLRQPQHIRQQQAHSGVVQILFPSHIRRSENLKLGEEKGWCLLLNEP
jgi:hypothetical protein